MTDTPFMRNQRNRDQWLSIAKFLQEQKPLPKFKRKPSPAQQVRALVATIVAKGSQMARHAAVRRSACPAACRAAEGRDIREPNP